MRRILLLWRYFCLSTTITLSAPCLGTFRTPALCNLVTTWDSTTQLVEVFSNPLRIQQSGINGGMQRMSLRTTSCKKWSLSGATESGLSIQNPEPAEWSIQTFMNPSKSPPLSSFTTSTNHSVQNSSLTPSSTILTITLTWNSVRREGATRWTQLTALGSWWRVPWTMTSYFLFEQELKLTGSLIKIYWLSTYRSMQATRFQLTSQTLLLLSSSFS